MNSLTTTASEADGALTRHVTQDSGPCGNQSVLAHDKEMAREFLAERRPP